MSGNRFDVYCVLVGSYDSIVQPSVVDDRFDYILFSDCCVDETIGIWQVRPIRFDSENRFLLSRYPKCLVNDVLGEYDASLYHDANIQIDSKIVYDRFIELFSSGIEWAGIKHPSQSCVYEEMCAIVSLRWVHDYSVVDWYGKLKCIGFPSGWGLYENNVIFRLHNSRVKAIGDMWWDALLKYCSRDQFSLMYALWIYRPQMDYVINDQDCPRIRSDCFRYYEHNKHSRIIKLGFGEKMRVRCLKLNSDSVRKGYMSLFNSLSRFHYPRIALFLWGILSTVKHSPILLRNYISNRLFQLR